MYLPGDSICEVFITEDADTGVASVPDATPAAALTRNGADDGAVTLTVANIDTGRYKVTGTIPGSYSVGDEVDVTVSVVTDLGTAKLTIPLGRLGPNRATDTSGGALATASKLKRYTQLLARSDAAITTDAATELSEINENAGSGAGAYANTTDSLEAAADRTSGAGSATLANQQAILAKINPARIVANDGTTAQHKTIYAGSDYSSSDTGRPLEWSVDDVDLTAATVQMSYMLTSAYEAGTGSWTTIGTGTVAAYSSGTNTVRVSLTAAQVNGLTAVSPPADKYAYTYKVEITLSGRVRRSVHGGLNVVQ